MSTAAVNPGVTYQIDSSHSHAQFKVRHMMIANVKGEFTKVSGTVAYDPANLAAASVQATIDVNTVNTREPGRDADLKSANFFDAEKFPTITFSSKKVSSTGDGSLTVAGDLTMHGVTKEITLHVEELTPEAKDPWGNMRRGLTAKTKLSRKQFGLEWNVALEAGGFLIGDDIDITIDAELIRQ